GKKGWLADDPASRQHAAIRHGDDAAERAHGVAEKRAAKLLQRLQAEIERLAGETAGEAAQDLFQREALRRSGLERCAEGVAEALREPFQLFQRALEWLGVGLQLDLHRGNCLAHFRSPFSTDRGTAASALQ